MNREIKDGEVSADMPTRLYDEIIPVAKLEVGQFVLFPSVEGDLGRTRNKFNAWFYAYRKDNPSVVKDKKFKAVTQSNGIKLWRIA